MAPGESMECDAETQGGGKIRKALPAVKASRITPPA